ncbi:hypothetical protein HAX54_024985 [Datura stramonium]|uniref:Uncharacterized protein n=1 Tax=Datura stramonium TaxID=4076 RepID=A0ABS8UZG4_DATST|nr:hypothetical protein [Datura stramonium]
MRSNIGEGDAMDRVDSAVLEETTDFKNLPTNFVNHYTKEGSVMDIADPTILEEHGIEIQQQLEAYLDLVKKCTSSAGEDRLYMIHVARELRQIDVCFRALNLGQN